MNEQYLKTNNKCKKLYIVKCVILLFVRRVSREYKAVKPCSNVKNRSTILDMSFKWKKGMHFKNKKCSLKTNQQQMKTP